MRPPALYLSLYTPIKIKKTLSYRLKDYKMCTYN